MPALMCEIEYVGRDGLSAGQSGRSDLGCCSAIRHVEIPGALRSAHTRGGGRNMMVNDQRPRQLRHRTRRVILPCAAADIAPCMALSARSLARQNAHERRRRHGQISVRDRTRRVALERAHIKRERPSRRVVLSSVRFTRTLAGMRNREVPAALYCGAVQESFQTLANKGFKSRSTCEMVRAAGSDGPTRTSMDVLEIKL